LKEGPWQKLPDSEKEYADEILGDLSVNLEKITYHGNRASSIVKGMLEHSRMSTGERKLTDLNALADEYLRLAYHGLRAKDKNFNCELVTRFDAGLPTVNVVAQDISRVLLNLFTNAFYAVAEKKQQLNEADAPAYKPTVTVTTAYVNGKVDIRVLDNGTGMPDSVKAKIFQPFFTTKPAGSGTGLGLSLSYDIITKGHGGTLTVDSTPGEGTEFTLTLLADEQPSIVP
ncbi:MAG: HAMP domain-containing histidine kinase, partial [Cytophagaceae bacterium]